MVSTRQSSSVGGGGESSGALPEAGSSKSVRHNNAPTGPPAVSEPSTSGITDITPVQNRNLMDFPTEILLKIMSYLPYRNIAHLRPVCRKMDGICCAILNSTFQRLQAQMLQRFQSIKAKMPRRESARRNHPLACESDIIETLHMRLTLLQMTFGKHIERKHCCFFAGEILDEVYRILHYIKVTQKLSRPYKVTDELFDLSTMAMEYFKEHIEPTLPEITYFGTDFLDFTGTFASTSSNKTYLSLDSPPHNDAGKGDESPQHAADERVPEPLPQSNMVLRKRIRKIKQGMKRYNNQLALMRRDLRNCKGKIAEQQKQILEYASRLDENDKKNEETSRKFSTLLQELNKCKTELQYWRSKSPAVPPLCTTCGKVMTPATVEDLQALTNQGVVPESLGLEFPAEGEVNVLPVAGTSTSEGGGDNYWSMWESSKKEEEVAVATQKKDATTATITSAAAGVKKDDDPLLPTPAAAQPTAKHPGSGSIVAIKRKAADDVLLNVSASPPHVQDYKKPRRIHKGRSKRAKV